MRRLIQRSNPLLPYYFARQRDLEVLESGGKAAPKELLRPFGVDLADPGFWGRGIKIIEDLVIEAERESLG